MREIQNFTCIHMQTCTSTMQPVATYLDSDTLLLFGTFDCKVKVLTSLLLLQLYLSFNVNTST